MEQSCCTHAACCVSQQVFYSSHFSLFFIINIFHSLVDDSQGTFEGRLMFLLLIAL